MSKIFRRVTGVFKRKPRNRRVSPTPTPNPYNRRSPGQNTRAAPERDDDSDDEEGSIIEEYSSPSPRARKTPREIEPSRPNNRPLRPVSNGIEPSLPTNADTNNTPRPTPPSPPGPNPVDQPLPAPQQASLDGQRTEISPAQPSLPSATRIAPTPVRRSLTPLMNLPRRPLQISPHSALIGFPSDSNPRPATFPQRPYRSFSTFQPIQQRPRQFSHYDYDYPIENVVIDSHIPSFMATKINRAVDQDRFGHTRSIERRTGTRVRPNAVRHIREIPLQNTYNPPLIVYQAPQIQCSYRCDSVDFPRPFHHFVAYALPNDPMRNY